ncbi:unnamed protein product [Alopecurus aequalis]
MQVLLQIGHFQLTQCPMAAPRDGNSERRDAKVCAVTGGRGFLARHLVAALLRSGEWRVRVTDLAPVVSLESGEDEELLGAALRDGRAVYMPADVRDLAQLTRAFQDVDVVFHMAVADHAKNNIQLHREINVTGTNNVIDACIACKVKRLIYTSSIAVVFDGLQGLFDVDESKPYPDKFPDAYGQTKAEAEKLVLKANGTSGLLTCCIRPGSIFGPGNNYFISNLGSFGGMKIIIGDGENYDDFVYVENVVHGHISAERTLSTKEGGERIGGKAYFISNMQPMSMWDFVYMFSEELGYKSRFKIRIPSYLLMPVTYVVDWCYNNQFFLLGIPPLVLTSAKIKYITLNRTVNCNRAVEDLDYTPVVSLKEGVKITAEYYNNLRA